MRRRGRRAKGGVCRPAGQRGEVLPKGEEAAGRAGVTAPAVGLRGGGGGVCMAAHPLPGRKAGGGL